MNIIQSPSPNFNSRNGSKIEAIVIHCTDGTFPNDLEFLKNPTGGEAGPVSSHYLVAPNGGIYSLVKEADRAWCNGRVLNPTANLKKNLLGGYINPNDYTISIEVSMRATDGTTVAQYNSLKELVRDICARNGISIDRQHIWGHKEIYAAKTCPGTISVDTLVKTLTGQMVDKAKIIQEIRDRLNLL